MKKNLLTTLYMTVLSLCALGQTNADSDKTLLWKISGNGLARPSYLYGTIHMLCKDDAGLSDSLRRIIARADEVYLEADLDNMMEMMSLMKKMKMQGDTTLQDLLSVAEYDRVKKYFDEHSRMIPFSMLQTYKPIMAASLLQQSNFKCAATAMESEIMTEAKKQGKKIEGLETMDFQASLLDQIPYGLQAKQLVEYIDEAGKGAGQQDQEFDSLMQAYREQDLKKLEQQLLRSDIGMAAYTDVLLYKRNENWITKLKTLLPSRQLLIAVGAGHLPGDRGVINLLRKAGYKLTPVRNSISGGASAATPAIKTI